MKNLGFKNVVLINSFNVKVRLSDISREVISHN